MSERILTCPWISLSERKAVFYQLFEGSYEDKMNAIGRIEAWKARSYPNVPLGLEVTLALVHALDLPTKSHNESVELASGTIESVICMALIRFVNLITEVGQVANFKISIKEIAEKMGVPEWIVDLRHAATHSHVPSLHILITAAEWCLDWVKINYWMAEETFIKDVVKMPPTYKKDEMLASLFDVKAELLAIKTVCEKNMKKGILKSNIAKNKVALIVKNILRSTSSYDLARMLTSDGLIFPESQLSITRFSDIEADPSLALHQFQLWKPVLKVLGRSDCLVDLINALIVEMNRRPSSVKGKLASTWISLILGKFAFLEKLKKNASKSYTRLLKVLLKASPAHVQLAISNLPKHKRDKLAALASRKLTWATARSTAEELWSPKTRLSSTVVYDNNIGAYPLGRLPSQHDSTSLHLKLPTHVDNAFDLQNPSNINELAEVTIPRANDDPDAEIAQLEDAAWLL